MDRFWEKADKVSSPNGCWLWTGAIFSTGYIAKKFDVSSATISDIKLNKIWRDK